MLIEKERRQLSGESVVLVHNLLVSQASRLPGRLLEARKKLVNREAKRKRRVKAAKKMKEGGSEFGMGRVVPSLKASPGHNSMDWDGKWRMEDGPQHQQHHSRGMKDINGESLVLFLWETLYALESNIYRREEPQHQSLAPTHAEETCQVACKARRSYKKASFGTNPSLISARVCCDVAIPPVKGEFLVFLFFLNMSSDSAQGRKEELKGSAQDKMDQAGQKKEDMKGTAQEKMEQTRDKAGETKDQASGMFQQMGDKVKQAADKTKETLAGTGDRMTADNKKALYLNDRIVRPTHSIPAKGRSLRSQDGGGVTFLNLPQTLIQDEGCRSTQCLGDLYEESLHLGFTIKVHASETRAVVRHGPERMENGDAINNWSQARGDVRRVYWLGSDESATIGRLIRAMTTKGKSDHAELQELRGSTTKSFVEHVKRHVGSADGQAVEQLYVAVTRIFGRAFAGIFVCLCENAHWEESGLIYEDVYSKASFSLPRSSWIRDCQSLLFCRHVWMDVEEDNEKGVYLVEEEKTCVILAALKHKAYMPESPGIKRGSKCVDFLVVQLLQVRVAVIAYRLKLQYRKSRSRSCEGIWEGIQDKEEHNQKSSKRR
ncbi:hypothetical protein SELMODRAFT_443147 [Selaginella moellendorffii]|uniref:Uncharacterized protein n=2 Tax=Selaginella moellendorffii TaxID=88036 RepID=D8RZ05_SELML|nr:hypothetical protein SELMODRAFT_443147 [Selaginella moellendorffii]